MLQLRVKGSTGQFYNPQRDMVYIWPKALRASLVAFDNFEGDEKCSKQEMLDAASALAKITADIVKNPTLPAQTGVALEAWDRQYPNAAVKIKNSLFHAVFGVFTAWTMDVRPKTSDDYEIPTVGLDEVSEFMARESIKLAQTERNA